MEMNPINVLRRAGLLETLAFKFSSDGYSGWDFDNTYEYYVYMTLKICWRSL